MKALRIISYSFIFINIVLALVYLASFLMLKSDSLSVKIRLFFFLDFPGYLFIAQVISVGLYFIYTIKKKKKIQYLILVILIVAYFLFDYFLNGSAQLYNPV
jgi:hypothetical protein